MYTQTASKERAAARRGCQAGTLSPDFECKHGFIIRLFFWVILAMPWPHWMEIKAQYFTNHPATLLKHPAEGGRAEKLGCLAAGVPRRQMQPAKHSPGQEGTETQVTQKREQRHKPQRHPAVSFPTAMHTAEPFQGKAESDGGVWGKESPATSQLHRHFPSSDDSSELAGFRPNSTFQIMQQDMEKTPYRVSMGCWDRAARSAGWSARRDKASQDRWYHCRHTASSSLQTSTSLLSAMGRKIPPLHQRPGAGPRNHGGRTRIELTMSLG